MLTSLLKIIGRVGTVGVLGSGEWIKKKAQKENDEVVFPVLGVIRVFTPCDCKIGAHDNNTKASKRYGKNIPAAWLANWLTNQRLNNKMTSWHYIVKFVIWQSIHILSIFYIISLIFTECDGRLNGRLMLSTAWLGTPDVGCFIPLNIRIGHKELVMCCPQILKLPPPKQNNNKPFWPVVVCSDTRDGHVAIGARSYDQDRSNQLILALHTG